MELSEIFIGNQVCAGERVAVSLLQSNCGLFVKVLATFDLANVDTTEKMPPKDFIVIISCRSCL